MKNTLLFVVFATIGLFGTRAHAEALLLDTQSADLRFAGALYRADTLHGTAWLDLEFVQDKSIPDPQASYTGPHYVRTTLSVPVSGLSYDSAASQYVYAGQTGKVVCGTVTERHGKSLLRLTGDCAIYTIRNHKSYSVYFEAK